MDLQNIQSIISDNMRRRKELFSPYNPVTGEGSPIERVKIGFSALGRYIQWGIPISMYADYKTLLDSLVAHGSVKGFLESTGKISHSLAESQFVKDLTEIRFKYDFEFWAIICARVQDKDTKKIIPFKLNKPQRKTLLAFEKKRMEGQPIRIIILKARQWGGSTFVQLYMAWIQIIHKMNWHSTIVADVENQSRNIRGMYSRLIKEYNQIFGKFKLVPYEGSNSIRMIDGRNCIVAIGSVQKPESLRSYDFSMTHLSEVGAWRSTPQKSAEDLVQNLRATVPDVPYSLAVLESTAKGVGNFFHREWISAKEGKTSYTPVFIPWFEIERYQKPINNYEAFIKSLEGNDYAHFLWDLGATLEGIKWYFDFKQGENYDDWRMFNEFPSTDTEAFSSSDRRAFAPRYVQAARMNKLDPEYKGDLVGKALKGEESLKEIEFQSDSKGNLYIWAKPDRSISVSDRYVVAVDIGGRWHGADYSVIRVIDRYWMVYGGKPEIVATWRGHLDQDLVAWKAAQIASYYNDALLIVESNSLDNRNSESEGNHFFTILDEIVKFYPNIYARTDPEKVRQGLPIKYGFQTNLNTKPMVIDLLNACLREESYVERDDRACDEMDAYEMKANGTYGAVDGCHDDIVMATAIGLWACFKYMPLPVEIKHTGTITTNKIISEATI